MLRVLRVSEPIWDKPKYLIKAEIIWDNPSWAELVLSFNSNYPDLRLICAELSLFFRVFPDFCAAVNMEYASQFQHPWWLVGMTWSVSRCPIRLFLMTPSEIFSMEFKLLIGRNEFKSGFCHISSHWESSSTLNSKKTFLWKLSDFIFQECDC